MKFHRQRFFASYKNEFGRIREQSVVQALEFLLTQFETCRAWSDLRHIAYALATIYHETAHTFEPIVERGSRQYFEKYEGRADLGNIQEGDSYTYRGRGYVQITGRRNYRLFTNRLGLNLIDEPELALHPTAAFHIMTDGMGKGLFTGKGLADYINSQSTDYANARRIINGTDKASLIAEYARDFEKILKASLINEDAEQELKDFNRIETAAKATIEAKSESAPTIEINPSAAKQDANDIFKIEPRIVEGGAKIEGAAFDRITISNSPPNETTPAFTPTDFRAYIPTIDSGKRWLGFLSGSTFLASAAAFFAGLPPWVVYSLLVSTGIAIGALGVLFIVYYPLIILYVRRAMELHANPAFNNPILSREKDL